MDSGLEIAAPDLLPDEEFLPSSQYEDRSVLAEEDSRAQLLPSSQYEDRSVLAEEDSRAQLLPSSQYEDRSVLAEEGRLSATPLLQRPACLLADDTSSPPLASMQSFPWPLRSASSSGSRSRANANLDSVSRESTTPAEAVVQMTMASGTRPRANADFLTSVSRESTTSTEALALLALETDGTAPSNSGAIGLSDGDFVDPSQLPQLAMGLLGRTFPESVEAWPATATTLVWRLQHLAVCMMALLALGFVVVMAAFVRGLEAWQSSAGQPCKPPLRWWLIGHVSILALGIMGCCSGMAFLGLAGWIAWGTALLQRRQTSKCPTELVQAVQEAMSIELMLFCGMLFVAVLAGCAARTIRKIHIACYDFPWDPESHLEFEDPMPVDLEAQDRMEEDLVDRSSSGGRDRVESSSCDRECVICCDALAGTEVIAKAGCGHRFHKSCILEWLQNHRTCPLCRQRIDKPLGWRRVSPLRAARGSEASQAEDGVAAE